MGILGVIPKEKAQGSAFEQQLIGINKKNDPKVKFTTVSPPEEVEKEEGPVRDLIDQGIIKPGNKISWETVGKIVPTKILRGGAN